MQHSRPGATKPQPLINIIKVSLGRIILIHLRRSRTRPHPVLMLVLVPVPIPRWPQLELGPELELERNSYEYRTLQLRFVNKNRTSDSVISNNSAISVVLSQANPPPPTPLNVEHNPGVRTTIHSLVGSFYACLWKFVGAVAGPVILMIIIFASLWPAPST